MTLIRHALAPDAGFLPAAARLTLDFAASSDAPHDLSAATLILPNLKLAAPLAGDMANAAGHALLLPQMHTLSSWVEPCLASLSVLPDSRRQLILHALLRGKGWFDETMLWDVIAELLALFDSLTEASVSLPQDEAELLTMLEAAFELKQSASLAFEARLVNTLWLAEAQGRPSRTIARLLAARQAAAALQGPLVVIAECRDTNLIEPLLALAATRVPVMLIVPDREQAQGPLATTLCAAWPLEAAPDLRERALSLASEDTSAFQAHTRFVACDSLELLGQSVANQVLDWLHAGRRNIALVAADRIAARRARALLEREGVLVLDETGWKMSTTRVAAVVDTWLEVLASDAYHRAVVDLLRSPMVLLDVPAMQRGEASIQIERLIRDKNIATGLARMIEACQDECRSAALVLGRLREAGEALVPHQPGTMADWLRRLEKSLLALGMESALEQDQAGRAWLEWLHVRTAELAEDEERFSFSHWRTWFNRQMDAVLFRDESIDSPVIMTHLAATRLRRFDAAIVIGADTEHLAPPRAPGWLSHAGVRHQLGLPGTEIERAQLQEDLAGLLLASDACLIAWQGMRRDEELMPAAEVAVLTATLALAGGAEVVERGVAQALPGSPDTGTRMPPAPSIPPSRVPDHLSASGMQTLLDCPYRYFARYVLGLAETEDLREEMEKRDFGEQLHTILERFHRRFPRLAGQPDALLHHELEVLTEAAFAEAVARNFQDHAWRLRWRARIPAYIAWQRTREAEAWFWAAGEESVEREHALGHARLLRLKGRIDRRDQREASAGSEEALLDYKSRGAVALRKQVKDPDDVQLAFYSLLKGTRIAQAAYVALDDETVSSVAIDEPEARAAALQDCITESFGALYAGAGLPAHGSESVCNWCEMRGLCRKAWLA